MHNICDMHLHSTVKYEMLCSTTDNMPQLNDAHNQSTLRRNENIARTNMPSIELSMRSNLFACFSEIESSPTWDDITIRGLRG